jgi:predicted small metal-binding protein
VSAKPAGDTFYVLCDCGLRMNGTMEELVPIVQRHARDAHNMSVKPEDVKSTARRET